VDPLEITDRLGVGVLLIRDGLVRQANVAAHRLLDTRPGALVGRTIMEAFVDHTVEALVRDAGLGADRTRELVISTEPARTLIVRARRDRDGTVSVLIEDASELYRLRRIRTEFIDNLSHELRTPLATVRLLVESLAMELERTGGAARVREQVAKIDVETGHLVQMVSELVDLAAIEQGEAPLRLVSVDPNAVVERVLDRVRTFADRQGVTLTAVLHDDAGTRTIRADEERLGQMLLNLVHNAVKFTEPGGSVEVRTRVEGDKLLVEVADTGIGIGRADLARVFERFYKADRARTGSSGGTGLGLAIARHIAERQGGRISAESVIGKGSTFTVALPRRGSADPGR
jgi:two-component system, OmpR family, phosphate regulon sensor histidine kinase PhoR